MKAHISISFLALLLSTGRCFAADLPVMKIDNVKSQYYSAENTFSIDRNVLELGANMGDTLWGYAATSFETKWRDKLTFEIVGSGGYSSYDPSGIAAIFLDYGSKAGGYTCRVYFGVGLPGGSIPHLPHWESKGKNHITFGNLVVANSNPQQVTIDPETYAPKDWDGRLLIGLVVHNAGKGVYVLARIVNARPEPVGYLAQVDERVKALQKGSLSSYSQERYAYFSGILKGATDKMPVEFASSLRLFSPEETLRSAEQYNTVPEEKRHRQRIVLAQFENDAMGCARQQEAARALLAEWKKSGSFGKEIGCIVRHASNLVKVGVQDLTTGQVIKSIPDTIALSGARREVEGFQIVLTPLTNCVKGVKVSASEFKSKDFVIPQTSTKIHAVAYARVDAGKPTQL